MSHEVSKNEMLDFVKSYPEKLIRHMITICEPPIQAYSKIVNGRAVMVAGVVRNDLAPLDGKVLPNIYMIYDDRRKKTRPR